MSVKPIGKVSDRPAAAASSSAVVSAGATVGATVGTTADAGSRAAIGPTSGAKAGGRRAGQGLRGGIGHDGRERRRGGQLEGSFVQLRWRSASTSGKPQAPLTMAVAKKLLPRAIDRNRFRRIVREAWRAGGCAAVGASHAAGLSVFIRLMKTQPIWKTLPDGPLKRLWREELDRLLGELGARVNTPVKAQGR